MQTRSVGDDVRREHGLRLGAAAPGKLRGAGGARRRGTEGSRGAAEPRGARSSGDDDELRRAGRSQEPQSRAKNRERRE